MEDILCDTCAYNVYDEYDDCYYCEVSLDEDDVARMNMSASMSKYTGCPHYCNNDEYAIVRHQN